MNEEKKSGKIDKFTQYFDAFQKEIDKLEKGSIDTNDNGIDDEKLKEITGVEASKGEYLTPAQKSMSAD